MEQENPKKHPVPEVLKPCRDIPRGAARNGGIPCRNPHKQQPHGTVGATEDELYRAAMENLKNECYHIQSMTDLLSGMIGTALELPEDVPKQYVLTNESCRYGAAGMLREDILESFAEQAGGNFYILPSSVHELILVPEIPTISAKGLKEMVKEVNEGTVVREEWLSENVYYYDCVTREVKIGE